MKTIFFSVRPDERDFLNTDLFQGLEFEALDIHLNHKTVSLVRGARAVSIFVNDIADSFVIKELASQGTKLIALRCAGFNNVDLATAKSEGIGIVRVPAYSPYAVAEHSVALLLSLNRKFHRAYNRIREGNFSLDGLMGFDLHQKTIGVVGTGKIGEIFCKIMLGFGCEVIAYDKFPNENLIKSGVKFVEMDELKSRSKVISLHCPLFPETHHLIDEKFLAGVRKGVFIINTSRGALIDSKAMIDALKNGSVGGLGIDVYEEEGDIFFENLSEKIITDDILMRLTTFPNVLITGHQAFYTKEAVKNIMTVTSDNLINFAKTKTLLHPVN